MARIEANPTLSVLVWARESSGLSSEAAAQKAGIESERLLAWESGEEKPTFAQLRKLATIYKRPLAIFYLENPPKGFAPMVDYRRSTTSEKSLSTPELTFEIRKAHDRREWALELFDQIEVKPPEVTGATLPRNTEAAAAEVRRFLNVSLQAQTTWRTDYEAFKQWRLLIERAGILTFQANDVETTEARGFSVADRPLPVAIANIKDAPRGRIFTLLHELVHILLRESGICDLHESDEDEHSRVEAYCNRVAGAALFPQDALTRMQTVVKHKKGQTAWTDDELGEISRYFGGSREAALVRLLTLGYTTQEYYDEKREQFLKLYAEQKERDKLKGGFAPPLEVALTSVGPTFTSLVIESFNRERITASDVSDYLQIRLKHLADVQRDYSKLAV
ncbi:MAG TPA: XRE family transcriptional regulator [Terriglobales bacterium]|jgi:Zn-dependent peptidase ImmA (M78 family)/DNA-binding XRE family transcriptional regulator